MAIRILIVDDHDVVRQGLRSLLQARPQWEICGEAGDGREAVRLAQQLKPDAIILDVSMPVLGGLGAALEITDCSPACKILIVTMHNSATLAAFAQRSGAKGLVLKSRASQDLVRALEAVFAGQDFFQLDEADIRKSQKVIPHSRPN